MEKRLIVIFLLLFAVTGKLLFIANYLQDKLNFTLCEDVINDVSFPGLEEAI